MKLRKPKPDQNERRRPVTTTQSGVFSYYSQRPSTPVDLTLQLQPRRDSAVQPKIRRFKMGLLPSYIALFVIVLTVLYSLTLQPSPRLNVVNQPNTIHRSNQYYQQELEAIWRKSLLNQNKLTLNSERLKRDIRAQFPELTDVRIDLPLLGRRPAVTLVPATPALELVSGNDIYYVSQAGMVMLATKDATKNQLASLPLVRDETGLEASNGKIILSGTDIAFLTDLYRQLQAAKLTVVNITLPNSAANQADVRLSDQAYYIKFAMASDVRQAVGNYLAVLTKLQADNVTPKQYIDVRVDEKVFYQ